MANLYCKYLNSRHKRGSAFVDVGKGFKQLVESTGLDKKFSRQTKRLTKNLRESTGISQKRIKTISDLSETNMKLLEDNLERLDKTITIYNNTGMLAGVTAGLGSILIGLKIYRHFAGPKSVQFPQQ
tara:strand:- start:23 stop:403 length:381 start_codon:yes stop_codon:yes gene_type:complete